MPRNMSFAYTIDAVKERRKTVTRRVGWRHVKAGEIVNACEKCMGLKPGEKVNRLAMIRIKSVSREPLKAITAHEVEREGHQGKTPEWFVERFSKNHKGVTKDSEVTRIEYEYL